jgi:DNA-binding XRE family transcriptional regulator
MSYKHRIPKKSDRQIVLMLREESYRLVAAAAEARGQTPEAFALEALRRRCRQAFANLPVEAAGPGTRGRPAQGRTSMPVAIRPTANRVLQVVAQVYGVPIEAFPTRRRSRQVSAARWAAMYLLANDAGLDLDEIARLTGRGPGEVQYAIREFEAMLEDDDADANAIEQCRGALRNGSTSGLPYPTRPWSPESTSFLPMLARHRSAAGLTQAQLGERAGLPRETVAILESLKRAAKPETARALAAALGVSQRDLVFEP